MEKKLHLTNELLAKKFKSNFELVNYAIQLAENMIRSGRDARVKSEIQNRAMLILEEIFEGKDSFDQIIEKPEQVDRYARAAGEVEEMLKHKMVMEEMPSERKRAKVLLSEDE